MKTPRTYGISIFAIGAIIAINAMMLLNCQMATAQESKPAKLDYKVVDGKFATSKDKIPAGCLAQLMTQLNGDNSVDFNTLTARSLRTTYGVWHQTLLFACCTLYTINSFTGLLPDKPARSFLPLASLKNAIRFTS